VDFDFIAIAILLFRCLETWSSREKYATPRKISLQIIYDRILGQEKFALTNEQFTSTRSSMEPQTMQFIPTENPEVVIIEPQLSKDTSGFLMETYQARKFNFLSK
jgi:hypothetical protein